ncbi:MAG: hypothetical protein HY673_18300 [Chloroflexi bacterium]|nr:hypothetical protein [Chloroflexota bacterium]
MTQTSATVNPPRKRIAGIFACSVLLGILLISSACGEDRAPTTTAPPITAPATVPSATQPAPGARTAVPSPGSPAATAQPPAAAIPPRTPAPVASTPGAPPAQTATQPPAAPSPAGAVLLQIAGPADESILTSSPAKLSGTAALDAVVSVNGRIVPVGDDGHFDLDVTLLEGPNLLEVVATDSDGRQSNQILTVIYIP